MKLFLDNADNGRNAANDELIAALWHRARQIQALADLRARRGSAREDDGGRSGEQVPVSPTDGADLKELAGWMRRAQACGIRFWQPHSDAAWWGERHSTQWRDVVFFHPSGLSNAGGGLRGLSGGAVMITWDLSTREWHAIDHQAEHPDGVFRTACGQLLSSKTTTLHERFRGTVCEECARQQMAAALRTVSSTNAGRPPVELPHVPPGGRPAPQSPLRSSVTALIRAVANRAVTSLPIPDRGPRSARRRQVRLKSRLAAGLRSSPRASRGWPARLPR